jgi:hypothetical protein
LDRPETSGFNQNVIKIDSFSILLPYDSAEQ